MEPEQSSDNGDSFVKLLGLIHKVFDNELDQTAFEEQARHIFATKAYIVFTLDKVIAALLKHVSEKLN
jgi:paired amphipathic helix protein Sin3a